MLYKHNEGLWMSVEGTPRSVGLGLHKAAWMSWSLGLSTEWPRRKDLLIFWSLHQNSPFLLFFLFVIIISINISFLIFPQLLEYPQASVYLSIHPQHHWHPCSGQPVLRPLRRTLLYMLFTTSSQQLFKFSLYLRESNPRPRPVSEWLSNYAVPP